MNRKLWYKAITHDREGKVLSTEEQPARSFLGLWNKLIWAQMAQADVAAWRKVKDFNGDDFLYSRGQSGWNFRMDGPIDSDDFGIVIGTGNTPVAVSDFKLASQMGNAQIHHLETVIADPAVVDPNCDFLVSRQFLNTDGGFLTVRESGIYVWLDQTPSIFTYGCVVRDVFAVQQDIPLGGGITIEYTLRVTE
ncbi:MAG: hypothetical protein JW712_00960 [Dehalococcoidales bacterium]|nr:hypothetical protein [Dehalococcoidales bacterium]